MKRLGEVATSCFGAIDCAKILVLKNQTGDDIAHNDVWIALRRRPSERLRVHHKSAAQESSIFGRVDRSASG